MFKHGMVRYQQNLFRYKISKRDQKGKWCWTLFHSVLPTWWGTVRYEYLRVYHGYSGAKQLVITGSVKPWPFQTHRISLKKTNRVTRHDNLQQVSMTFAPYPLLNTILNPPSKGSIMVDLGLKSRWWMIKSKNCNLRPPLHFHSCLGPQISTITYPPSKVYNVYLGAKQSMMDEYIQPLPFQTQRAG